MSEAIKRGDRVGHQTMTGEFKVMAVADGYAMIRRPGRYPFVEALKWLTAAPRSSPPTDRGNKPMSDEEGSVQLSPGLLESLETMTRETAEREPVRDDFAWLPRCDAKYEPWMRDRETHTCRHISGHEGPHRCPLCGKEWAIAASSSGVPGENERPGQP